MHRKDCQGTNIAKACETVASWEGDASVAVTLETWWRCQKKALTSNSVCNTPMKREVQVYRKRRWKTKREKVKIMRKRERRSRSMKYQNINHSKKERSRSRVETKYYKVIKKYIYINRESLYSSF